MTVEAGLEAGLEGRSNVVCPFKVVGRRLFLLKDPSADYEIGYHFVGFNQGGVCFR